MSTTTKEVAASGLDAKPVEGKVTHEWWLKLNEENGKCRLEWSTNAPFRAAEGWVALFIGPVPPDPEKRVAWTYDNRGSVENGWRSYVTGLVWGSNYSAAWIARNDQGQFVYLVKTSVT